MITSRRFRAEDAEELNASYCRFTSMSRTLEQFRWEWMDTPEGQGEIMVIEDYVGNIVGQHGYIPMRLESPFDRQLLMGVTENTHLHEPYRGKGLYFPLEKKFARSHGVWNRFDLLCTMEGIKEQGEVRRKLGYHAVTTEGYKHYVKLIHPLTRTRRYGNVGLTETKAIGSISPELDSFWERNRDRHGITPARTSEYLKWRIFHNPVLTHRFFLAWAREDGRVVGHAITTPRWGKNWVHTLVDIVAEDRDPDLLDTILSLTIREMRESGVRLLLFTTLAGRTPLNQMAERNGFISIPKRLQPNPDAVMLVKSLREDVGERMLTVPSQWYFTPIMFEGVR